MFRKIVASPILNIALAFLVMFTIASCGDDDDENVVKEVIATKADFQGYAQWTQLGEVLTGKDPAGALGTAHKADNDDIFRTIYIKEDVDRGDDDQFPIGTTLLKELKLKSKDASDNDVFTVHGMTAMVKRGGDFNPDHNGWEWFMLDSDGEIAEQGGGDLMCNGCHAGSGTDNDYVFAK